MKMLKLGVNTYADLDPEAKCPLLFNIDRLTENTRRGFSEAVTKQFFSFLAGFGIAKQDEEL